MCVLPAIIFLIYRKKFLMYHTEKRIWTLYSLLSLGCFFSLFLTSASTAIDRIALYLLPLQLAVFSYLPEVFGRKNAINGQWLILIGFYYTLVLFVWLFFAHHASAWLPYNFYPIEFVKSLF